MIPPQHFALPPRQRLVSTKALTGFGAGLLLLLANVGLALADEEEKATLENHDRWVIGAAFAQDGQTLASVGGESLLYRPGDVILWDTKTGSQKKVFTGHEASVWSVDVSYDGAKLVTSDYKGVVKLWTVETGETQDLEPAAGHWVRCVRFSPDGTRVYAGAEDGQIHVYDVLTGGHLGSAQAHEAAVYGLAVSGSGAWIVSCSTDKTAKVWRPLQLISPTMVEALPEKPETESSEEETETEEKEEAEPKQDADSDEEEGEKDPSKEKEEAEEPAQLLAQASAEFRGHEDAVWCVAISPNGKWIATGGADHQIKLWNLTGEEQQTLSGHRDWVTALAFSPDGKSLASGSHDQSVRLWRISDGETAHALEGGKSSLWCLAFSPDGHSLAVGTHDGIRIWDLGWKPRYEVKADDED